MKSVQLLVFMIICCLVESRVYYQLGEEAALEFSDPTVNDSLRTFYARGIVFSKNGKNICRLVIVVISLLSCLPLPLSLSSLGTSLDISFKPSLNIS